MGKGNAVLTRAKKEKNDEFYTQKKDIEKELIYYYSHLKDKIVYCNCDDYRKSKFVEYFIENFDKIGGIILSADKAVIDGKWINKKGCFTLDGKNLFKRFIIKRDDSIP